MKYFKIYGIFFKQYLKGLMEYRVDFLIGVFAFILTQGAGLLFLYIIFQNIQSLAGFTVDQILLMYGIGLFQEVLIIYSLITYGFYHNVLDKVKWTDTC